MQTRFGWVYKELFSLHPEILVKPALTLGHKEIFGGSSHARDCFPHGREPLVYNGDSVLILDKYDPRADLKYDLNEPIPVEHHERYNLVLDIGTIEHVFDTSMCLENTLSMLAVGGYLLLHTPVRGYFGHGMHTFNKDMLRSALALNGMRILWELYVGKDGSRGWTHRDVSIFVLSGKLYPLEEFVKPQELHWSTVYKCHQTREME